MSRDITKYGHENGETAGIGWEWRYGSFELGKGMGQIFQKRSESKKPTAIGVESEPGKHGGGNLKTNIGYRIGRREGIITKKFVGDARDHHY